VPIRGSDSDTPVLQAVLVCARAAARRLTWHGICAEVQCIVAGERSPAQLIGEQASSLQAGLVVLGGYGHRRVRELIFGGWTQSVLDDAGVPAVIAH